MFRRCVTGTVANGGITDDTTPTVHVVLTGSNAVAGDTVQLFNGGTALGEQHRHLRRSSLFLHRMSKRTRERCGAPAVRGSRACRFHGAGGGGPKSARNVPATSHAQRS